MYNIAFDMLTNILLYSVIEVKEPKPAEGETKRPTRWIQYKTILKRMRVIVHSNFILRIFRTD